MVQLTISSDKGQEEEIKKPVPFPQGLVSARSTDTAFGPYFPLFAIWLLSSFCFNFRIIAN